MYHREASKASMDGYYSRATATKTSVSTEQAASYITGGNALTIGACADNAEGGRADTHIEGSDINGYHSQSVATRLKATASQRINYVESGKFISFAWNSERDNFASLLKIDKAGTYSNTVTATPSSTALSEFIGSASGVYDFKSYPGDASRAFNKREDEINWDENITGDITGYSKNVKVQKSRIDFSHSIMDVQNIKSASVHIEGSHWDGYSYHFGDTFEKIMTYFYLQGRMDKKVTSPAFKASAVAAPSQLSITQNLRESGNYFYAGSQADSFRYDKSVYKNAYSASGNKEFTISAILRGSAAQASIKQTGTY